MKNLLDVVLNKHDKFDRQIIALVKSKELKLGLVFILIFFLTGCDSA
jgi:hypothetical protein